MRFLACWLVLAVAAGAQEIETVVEELPGGWRVEREELVRPDGERVAHGELKVFDAADTLRVAGEHRAGAKERVWRYFDAEAELCVRGKYRGGLRPSRGAFESPQSRPGPAGSTRRPSSTSPCTRSTCSRPWWRSRAEERDPNLWTVAMPGPRSPAPACARCAE